jgi:hypothetical protein
MFLDLGGRAREGSRDPSLFVALAAI